MSDGEFTLLNWRQIKEIVKENKLEQLQRRPSDLQRYHEYSHEIRQRYGSVQAYLLQERLRWGLNPKPVQENFTELGDWKILWNDWPYGIENNIVHLVVWTKFSLHMNHVTGQTDPETMSMINNFVKEKFESHVGRGNVIWFKNFNGLRSIPDIEHFHVMLLNPDPTFLQKVTDGDIPLYLRGN